MLLNLLVIFFPCFFLYIVVCCVLLPPFLHHSLLSLPTFPLSFRLRRCKTGKNAFISTMQLLLLSWDIGQGRQTILYGLTLCGRIWSASVLFSKLYFWASWFLNLFSWALQFTAEQRRGKENIYRKKVQMFSYHLCWWHPSHEDYLWHSLIVIVSMVS